MAKLMKLKKAYFSQVMGRKSSQINLLMGSVPVSTKFTMLE
jgi:hypothetical protein